MLLLYEKAALKALVSMQPARAAAIRAALQAIAADPFARHANVARLQGAENGFRLRHGDWRAIDVVDTRSGTVTVARIGPRGGVYR